MATPTYMIYNAETQSWDSGTYTLEELRSMTELDPGTHICTADGKRACTLGELLHAGGGKATFSPGVKSTPAASPAPVVNAPPISKEVQKIVDHVLENTDTARLIRVTADYIGLIYWLTLISVIVLLGLAVLSCVAK